MATSAKSYDRSSALNSNLAGNAIDFYVKVLGTSFHEAMKELTQESR